MIRVAVFDDNREQRDGMEAVFSSVPDVELVGAYASARTVLDDVKASDPQVVLMDIDMPEVDGITASSILREHYPELRIIMLTGIEDNDRIFAAIRAGADGYFLKQTAPARLIEGIKEVMEGGAPMTPSVARRVLRMMEAEPKPDPVRQNEFQLSERELSILGLLVKGRTYKRIASDLGVSYPTVNKHVSNVYVKPRVHSVNEAVALAIRKGLA